MSIFASELEINSQLNEENFFYSKQTMSHSMVQSSRNINADIASKSDEISKFLSNIEINSDCHFSQVNYFLNNELELAHTINLTKESHITIHEDYLKKFIN